MEKTKNIEEVKKKLGNWQNATGTIALLGILGVITSPIVWVWLGFVMFLKVLLTTIIVFLVGKFFNHVVGVVKKQIKDLDNPD